MTEYPTNQNLSKALRQALLWTLAAILILLPLAFKLDTHDQFELPKLILMRILIGLALSLLLFKYYIEKKVTWRATPLDFPVALWALWHLVKTWNSYAPAVSWRGEYENFAGSLTQLNFCLLYYLTTQAVTQLKQVRNLLAAFLITATVVSIYALMQALGLDFIGWASASVISDRFFASLGNPNFLGALVIMALPLCLIFFESDTTKFQRRNLIFFWAALLSGSLLWTQILPLFVDNATSPSLRTFFNAADKVALITSIFGIAVLFFVPLLLIKQKNKLTRYLLLLASAAVMIVALFNTGTRGAFLGALGSAGALMAIAALWLYGLAPEKRPAFFKKNIKTRFLAVLAGGVFFTILLAAVTVPKSTFNRFQWSLSHPAQAMDQSRWQIWGPSLEMIKEHPFTGMGVDTFKTMFPRYSGSKFAKYDGENVSSRMAHSEPLNIAATLGLIGLALWLWIQIAWLRAWLAHWRTRAKEENTDPLLILSALAGMWVAYHTQNLVSFGVVSITAPFWIGLGLLFACRPVHHSLNINLSRSGKGLMLAAALASAILLPLNAARLFSADKQYNFGHMVTGQNRRMQSLPTLEIYSLADWSYRQLKAMENKMEPDLKTPFAANELRWKRLQKSISNDPSLADRYRQNLIPLAQKLLLLLSALHQEEGVRLVPNEVKYHVFLGLAYEELLKRSSSIQEKSLWFARARSAYQRGVELNPENAYYRGNLGRLYSLMIEQKGSQAAQKAEAYYREAIARAGVTPLFYENLNLIFTKTGNPDAVLKSSAEAEKKDKTIGARVYFSAGAALFQRYRDRGIRAGILPGKEKVGSLLERYRLASWQAMEEAARLAPTRADVFHNRAVFYAVQGNPKAAMLELKKVFKINPTYQRSLDLARDLNLKP